MPSIQRRAFLGVVAAASGVTGCLSAPPTESTPTTATPPASDRTQIDVRNQNTGETTVDIRLTGAGGTLLDRQVTVPGESQTAVDTGIDETGEYELDAFVVDGPDLAAEFTVQIEEGDLQQGSNVILLVDGERIEMLMEE